MTYPRSRDEWRDMPATLTESELIIGGWQVMQAWELPLMKVLADIVTERGGDVLEVGFGMGISATQIIRNGCRTYTAIEANLDVVERARRWGEEQPVPVEIVASFWQDIVDTWAAEGRQFDAILFDTYPLEEAERNRNHYPFIPKASALLRPGGVLTYYSDETIDFRPEHLQLLLSHFDEVTLHKVTGLEPYPGTEYWQEDHMVIPAARKAPSPPDNSVK
jgi:guanidinoacetate N-methyltransferase